MFIENQFPKTVQFADQEVIAVHSSASCIVIGVDTPPSVNVTTLVWDEIHSALVPLVTLKGVIVLVIYWLEVSNETSYVDGGGGVYALLHVPGYIFLI